MNPFESFYRLLLQNDPRTLEMAATLNKRVASGVATPRERFTLETLRRLHEAHGRCVGAANPVFGGALPAPETGRGAGGGGRGGAAPRGGAPGGLAVRCVLQALRWRCRWAVLRVGFRFPDTRSRCLGCRWVVRADVRVLIRVRIRALIVPSGAGVGVVGAGAATRTPTRRRRSVLPRRRGPTTRTATSVRPARRGTTGRAGRPEIGYQVGGSPL